MTVGIVGMGSIGKRHARNAVALGHHVWAYDVGPFTLDSGIAGLVQTNLLWDLAGAVDAVLVCTPAQTHAAVAKELLVKSFSGPLFVEKPIALSVEECDVFTNWPNQTTMVGYNWRFHPLVVELQQRMRSFHERLTLQEGLFWVLCDKALWPGSAYASGLLECSHEIDLACVFAGDAVVRSAVLDGPQWLLHLDHPASGATTQVLINDAAPESKRGVRLKCEGEYVGGYDVPESLAAQALDLSYEDELAHFLDCAARGVPTMTPFADGLRVLDVIAQAQTLAQVPA